MYDNRRKIEYNYDAIKTIYVYVYGYRVYFSIV